MFGKMLKKRKDAAQASMSRMENRDLMEATIAGAVLVGMADGDLDDKEVDTLLNVLSTQDTMKHFGSEIGKTLDHYLDKFKAAKRVAKRDLMKEIKDVSGDETEKETVLLTILEVAESDGNIDDAEMKVLEEISAALGMRLQAYLD